MGIAFSQSGQSAPLGVAGLLAAPLVTPHRQIPSRSHGPSRFSSQASRDSASPLADNAHGLNAGDLPYDVPMASSSSASVAVDPRIAQLQSALTALGLDWAVVDNELERVTSQLLYLLLTISLRTQHREEDPQATANEARHHTGTSELEAVDSSVESQLWRSPAHRYASFDSVSDGSSGLQKDPLHRCINVITGDGNDDDEDVDGSDGDVPGKAQELYVSAALRLATLHLGREGVRRAVAALAFLANGGESYEDRVQRKVSGMSASYPVHRAGSSSQQIHHFQRSIGFTALATGVNAGSLPMVTTAAVAASSSTVNSRASSISTLPSRRFSTAPLGAPPPQPPPPPPPQQQQQQQQRLGSPSPTPSLNFMRSPLRGDPGLSAFLDPITASTLPYQHHYKSDELTKGHRHRPAPLPPTSCSYDEMPRASGHGGSPQRSSYPSLPRGAGLGNVWPLSAGGTERDAMTTSTTSSLHDDHSYNVCLLRSMNARSTLISTLRAGGQGDGLLSHFSIAPILSASVGMGRTPRGELCGSVHQGNSNSVNACLSASVPNAAAHPGIPLSPAAPGCGFAQQSMLNLSGFPTFLDQRQRIDANLRRGAAGDFLSPHAAFRVPGAAPGSSTTTSASRIGANGSQGYGLTDDVTVVGVGMESSVSLPAPHAGAGVANAGDSSSLSACDAPLRQLPPQAVLSALCLTFAHLHLATEDITNFVVLLAVAALQVQMDCQLRQPPSSFSEGSPNCAVATARTMSPSFSSSIPHIRSVVRECLGFFAIPLYRHVCQMLRLASSTFTSDNIPADDGDLIDSSKADLFTGIGGAHASHPAQPRAGSAAPSTPHFAPHTADPNSDTEERKGTKTERLASQVRALHHFFSMKMPLESTSTLRSMETRDAKDGASGKCVPPTAPRHARTRSQQQQLLGTLPPGAIASRLDSTERQNSSTGLSVTGGISSTHSSSLTMRSVPSPLPSLSAADATHLLASQADLRRAMHFLMHVEATFVLHYAEVIPEKELLAPASRSSGFPRKEHQRDTRSRSRSVSACLDSHDRPTPATPSRYCRSDDDADSFVQLSTDATVWPLRTRLLVQRHEYVYIYDAVASTMALLRDENLYATGTGEERGAQESVPQHATPHPHTPITVIDLNKAMSENDWGSVQLLSGPGDVEVVSLAPSRVSCVSPADGQRSSSSSISRARLSSTKRRRSNVGDKIERGAEARETRREQSGSDSADTSQQLEALGNDLLGACVADAQSRDVEVYRTKGRTGAMYLLSVPVENDATGAAPPTPRRCDSQPRNPFATTSANVNTTEALQASVIRSFRRNRLVRPAVLSLTTASRQRGVTLAAGCSNSSAEDTPTAAPIIGCGNSDGTDEALTLEHSTASVRIAAYPLRLTYKGVLHHFFFSNPSTRDQWYQRLLQISWMKQSRAYMEKIASAPQDVGRFLRNRISFPCGPGAFQCLTMLGAGTFGRVLLVQHKLSRRLFAMKVIRKSGFHGTRNVIEARREKKILETLDCPYIMRIHAFFQTDSRVYMLFDYLPGAELLLHTQSAHGHHFDEVTSRFYIAELAIAVEHLRRRGIVHRDIKGDNLVLDDEGHVVLTDFGFAKNIVAAPPEGPLPPAVIRQHTSCGTLAYIAPEVLYNSRRRDGYGLEADWWSLGVVLFTFLTGYFPFLKPTGAETSRAIVHSSLQFPSRPPLSTEARSVLNQLLQKNPAERISSLAQLQDHPFFADFNWDACLHRQLPPPMVLHKDSYQSPRATADARQLLQDRLRRSVAQSSGMISSPNQLPLCASRSLLGSSCATFEQPLEEEREELKLVEEAYGSESTPRPLAEAKDVFGALFEQQELCGSDRDDSDAEENGFENYLTGVAEVINDRLKPLNLGRTCGEWPSSGSTLPSCSILHENLNGSSEEWGVLADDDLQRVRIATLSNLFTPTAPVMSDFTEEMYADVALAKYGGGPSGC